MNSQMKIATTVVLLIGCGYSILSAQSQPVLVVPSSRAALHVVVPLPEGLKGDRAGAWQLVEIAQPGVTLPAQLITGAAADGSAGSSGAQLTAIIGSRDGATEPRRFHLQPATAGGREAGFRFQPVSDNSLGLWEGDRPVWVYNHGVITGEQVPESDGRRRRACYLHPVWGLNGEVLTDDFPKDHYHHHGVFWSWPHVGIEGQEYDLWTYGQIKQKFVRWICRDQGSIAAVLAVENGWFVGDKRVMIERVWIRTFKSAGTERAIDLSFTWIAVDTPITLQGAAGKSYGGLTMRFAPGGREDTVITVPSGRTEQDLPDTPLAWADFTSKFGDAPFSGAALLVHPKHPDFPPTWLTRHYGAMCIGWPGVKAKTFPPGQPIPLDYRIWIHKTPAELAELEAAYQAYTKATEATWQ